MAIPTVLHLKSRHQVLLCWLSSYRNRGMQVSCRRGRRSPLHLSPAASPRPPFPAQPHLRFQEASPNRPAPRSRHHQLPPAGCAPAFTWSISLRSLRLDLGLGFLLFDIRGHDVTRFPG